MQAKLRAYPKMLLNRLLGRFLDRPDVRTLYREKDYLTAYAEHTDLRVSEDPQQAIGGMWEEIGELQFDFLVKRGLQPHHTLLDIGCGTLRGGRHFIGYLDAGKYAGIDISPKAIAHAKKLVHDEGLSDKRPRLLLNTSKTLQFVEFAGEVFDFLLAQSVFSHLMPDHIEECFQYVGSVMKAESAFFFTFNERPTPAQIGLKDFGYPFSFFENLARRYHFHLEDCTHEYPHPRGQRMAKLSKPGTSR